jgi:hypothetical protein
MKKTVLGFLLVFVVLVASAQHTLSRGVVNVMVSEYKNSLLVPF